MAPISTTRLKKSQTSPEVWLAHRKLCKKIASAKWYAKKKKREIQEEHAHRKQLEAAYQQKKATVPYLWTDALNRAYWRCVVEHHVRGYPVRPPNADPYEWCHQVDLVESAIQATRERLRGVKWAQHVPWDDDLGFVKILRQLGWRQLHREGAPGWMTGSWGVFLAGCVRQWGPTTGWDMARAIVQTNTVQPIHNQSRATTHGAAIHQATPHPHPNPHQNVHQPDDDSILQQKCWILHTWVFPPIMSQEAWYQSDEEEDWLREFDRIEHDNAPTLPSYGYWRHTQPVPGSSCTPNSTEEKEEKESESDSVPSSLDHYIDDCFGLTKDNDPDSSPRFGPEDSDPDDDTSPLRA